MVSSDEYNRRQGWLVLALTLFSFFFLLGSRSLNEPDEGRYAEVAREMLETGNWLVPHIWYVPHLDKPPLTYWVVALSMTLFGWNEWAVRLPLALAGLSGAGAVYFLGRSLAGRRVALWSVLLLQSSLLYFVMARMLTPDIILTQFITWALYFGWRSWRSLDDLSAEEEEKRVLSTRHCFAWQLLAWTAMAFGFLTKGPIAVILPVTAMAGLAIYRRLAVTRWQLMLLGSLSGLMVFSLIVGPWFALAFQAVPGAFDYMVKGQALGHALGTTIKNRSGSPFYYLAILAVGFLPWTFLLGWLWRKAHWRGLNPKHKEAWVWLTTWVGATFLLFSLMRAKLPAYILPIFPALSVLVSMRWFSGEQSQCRVPAPRWIWRCGMLSPLVMLAAIPFIMRFIFKATEASWLWPVLGFALTLGGLLGVLNRAWTITRCAQAVVLLGLLSLFIITALVPTVETSLKANQTLKPLAAALKAKFQSGDILVCSGPLPQGLPFYAYPVINAHSRPYLSGLALNQVPFEFPGNVERMGNLVLPDEAAYHRLLAGEQRVWVIGFQGTYQRTQAQAGTSDLHFITRVGRWELFANR